MLKEVNRCFQSRFTSILEELGFDCFGFPIISEWESLVNKEGVCDNPIFSVYPYSDADKQYTVPNFEFKPLGLKIYWHKYPLRDAYSNIEITEELLNTVSEACFSELKKVRNVQKNGTTTLPNRFKQIVICGSSRFKDDFVKISREMTLNGVIAIPLNIYTKAEGIKLDSNKENMLKAMQMQKIAESDGIFIINKNGYIGENTKEEIEYAMSLGKSIEYLERT